MYMYAFFMDTCKDWYHITMKQTLLLKDIIPVDPKIHEWPFYKGQNIISVHYCLITINTKGLTLVHVYYHYL